MTQSATADKRSVQRCKMLFSIKLLEGVNNFLTLMHDCMRLSGMFFMLAIGGGSAEMKHLTYDTKSEQAVKEKQAKSFSREYMSSW